MANNPWIRTVYTCASCKKDRGLANHWHIIIQTADEITVYKDWSDRRALQDNAMPICGSDCLHRIMHLLMEKQ